MKYDFGVFVLFGNEDAVARQQNSNFPRSGKFHNGRRSLFHIGASQYFTPKEISASGISFFIAPAYAPRMSFSPASSASLSVSASAVISSGGVFMPLLSQRAKMAHEPCCM